MADEIKEGDIVSVKSGGPLMTVGYIQNGLAYCDWFEGKKPCHDSFNLSVLEKHEKNTGEGFQQARNW